MDFDVTFLSHAQPRDCGDYRHRTLWPAQALGELVTTTAIQTTHPDLLSALAQTRLLVVGMVVDADVLALIEHRSSVGLPTVYEISDDYRDVPANTELHAYYSRPDVQSLIEQMALACDAVQYSSPFLAEKYKRLSGQRAVFMNEVWEVGPLADCRPATPRGVGWTGSAGHVDDAERLAGLLQHASGVWGSASLFDQMRFSVMTSSRIAQCFTSRGVPVSHTPMGSWEEYLQFIGGIQVGLAILGETDFAQGRSDGKYIEYASCGVAALCHESGTFAHTIRHGENGLLYANEQEFVEGLRGLVTNDDLLMRIRAGAHQDLMERRNHKAAASRRLDFYGQLVESTQSSPLAHSRSPLKASPGEVEVIHAIEAELMSVMREHNLRPTGKTLQRYHHLTKQAPDCYRIWERFAALYAQLGLTDQTARLAQRVERTKAAALSAALQPAGG